MTKRQHTYQFISTQNLGSSSVKNLIAKNEYDKLGQLITKKVGGTAANASDRWQEINYKYNIRGWLTNINDIGLVMAGRGLPPPSPSDDLFSFAIQYNQLIEPGSGDYTSPLYNGNIAQTFWKTASDNTLRGYNYEYDQLNRLLNAEFYKKGTSPYSNAYKESLAYDLNGNITSLFRTTADASNNAIHMDDLTYAYENGNGNSNQLTNVSDAVSTQNTDGFVDGNTSLSLDDYEYDANGNMVKDRNKGIESIHYNHLNLPTKITWSNNKYIAYQYNAIGQKIRKTVEYTDSLKIVDYLDGFQYAGTSLQFFPHAEGYVKASTNGAQSLSMFNYVFNYTDHLGNVRLSYSKDPQTGTLEILDEDHYYPFGLKHGVYTAATLKDFRIDGMGTDAVPGGEIGEISLVNVTKTEYQYKYNGKELQDELGLNWYDYGARNYDATIGRWMNVDPLAEHPNQVDKSPYAYAWNNPINLTDPDGRCPDCPVETYIPLADAAYSINKGDKTSNGWTAIRVDSDDTGYRAVLFQGEYNGNTEYVYATAGSDDIGDWVNNIDQLSGSSEQYRTSVGKANDLVSSGDYEGISFTGHSLGGGLASANALSTEGKAVTFNAAGLSDATKEANGLVGNTANITAVIVKGEIVDNLQRTTPGLNRAEGNKIIMPPAHSNWNNINRVRNHMMGAVKTSFEKYKQELVEQYKSK